MPFLGPNCYGMVNFFDRVALWPDQVVGGSPERGVALISQSGTIALTLMFNDRSLPIGYLLTVGNQARLAAEDLIDVLSDDPRVTAFGLYLEGIKDTAKFARAVDKARARGKPIALVKSGRTETASRTARSHTGALSGSRRRVRRLLRAGRHRPLRDAVDALRNAEDLPRRRTAGGTPRGRHGRVGRRHGNDRGRCASPGAGVPAVYRPPRLHA